MKRIIVCSLAIVFATSLLTSSPTLAHPVEEDDEVEEYILYGGGALALVVIGMMFSRLIAADVIERHEAEYHLVKDKNSHLADFEPYVNFDADTDEFQTGVRYKIQW